MQNLWIKFLNKYYAWFEKLFTAQMVGKGIKIQKKKRKTKVGRLFIRIFHIWKWDSHGVTTTPEIFLRRLRKMRIFSSPVELQFRVPFFRIVCFGISFFSSISRLTHSEIGIKIFALHSPKSNKNKINEHFEFYRFNLVCSAHIFIDLSNHQQNYFALLDLMVFFEFCFTPQTLHT